MPSFSRSCWRSQSPALFIQTFLIAEWPIVLAEAWARYGRGNVIIVDWRVHASTFYLNTSSKQIFQVAEAILNLLEIIRDLRGTKREEFYKEVHAVGHSLGAQILGILGSKIRKNFNVVSAAPTVLLGVIYALDPAGCWLRNTYSRTDAEEFEFLSDESAHLVMVLHTSQNYGHKIGALGLKYVIGHYDFYVFVAEGLDDWCPNEACDHVRAPNLFKAALESAENDVDHLIGFKCHDLVANDMGKMLVREQETAIFGLNKPDAPSGNAYYVPINNQSPYNIVPNKTERDMKKCEIVPKGSLVGKTRRKVKDIKFTAEKTEAGHAFRLQKDIPSWANKCKLVTPSPFPIKVVWDGEAGLYKNTLLQPARAIGAT